MKVVDWQRKCIKNKQTRFLLNYALFFPFFWIYAFGFMKSETTTASGCPFLSNNRIHFWRHRKAVVSQEAACKSSPSFLSFCVGHCFWRWSATTLADQKSSKWPLATPPPSTSKMALGSTLLAGFKTDFSAVRIHCLWREGLSTYPLLARRPLSIQSCLFCLIYPIGTKVAFAENW